MRRAALAAVTALALGGLATIAVARQAGHGSAVMPDACDVIAWKADGSHAPFMRFTGSRPA